MGKKKREKEKQLKKEEIPPHTDDSMFVCLGSWWVEKHIHGAERRGVRTASGNNWQTIWGLGPKRIRGGIEFSKKTVRDTVGRGGKGQFGFKNCWLGEGQGFGKKSWSKKFTGEKMCVEGGGRGEKAIVHRGIPPNPCC